MKYGAFLAVLFAFFLIAIFPYYAGNDEPALVTTDSDGDGITDNKDECPREKPAPGQDLDENGCIDSEISKEEIEYLDRLSQLNLAQQLIFALVAVVGGALYWERKKIRSVLYDEDEFVTDFKKSLEEDKGTENVDYDKLGEDKVYTKQTGSMFDGFKFSFKDFNAEADRGIQIISLLCLVCFLVGPTQGWLQVDGVTGQAAIDSNDTEGTNFVFSEEEEFEATYYSDYWETKPTTSAQYENSRCTDEIRDIYNCNYRSSLFGSMEQLLTLSALFCFIVFILNFRSEKYKRGITIFFTLCLITTMASLLIFTSLIDNAIESDSYLLEEENLGKCWMEESRIWGEVECVKLIDDKFYRDSTTYSPGIGFWIILINCSTLFLGLFTSIEPLLIKSDRTWTEAIRDNWQVFALIFAIFFLWRLNELMSNL